MIAAHASMITATLSSSALLVFENEHQFTPPFFQYGISSKPKTITKSLMFEIEI